MYYALAEFILADEPEERVLSCARRSKGMMKGLRARLFSLILSFIFWYILVIAAASCVSGIAGPVLALVAEMLGSLFISVYMLTSEGAFFESLRKAPVQAVPAEETPDAE